MYTNIRIIIGDTVSNHNFSILHCFVLQTFELYDVERVYGLYQVCCFVSK